MQTADLAPPLLSMCSLNNAVIASDRVQPQGPSTPSNTKACGILLDTPDPEFGLPFVFLLFQIQTTSMTAEPSL